MRDFTREFKWEKEPGSTGGWRSEIRVGGDLKLIRGRVWHTEKSVGDKMNPVNPLIYTFVLSEEWRGLRVEFGEKMAKNFPKLTRALTHRPRSCASYKYRENHQALGRCCYLRTDGFLLLMAKSRFRMSLQPQAPSTVLPTFSDPTVSSCVTSQSLLCLPFEFFKFKW